MSNYQYCMDMAQIFGDAERRCTINEKPAMATIWAAKRRTAESMAAMMTLERAVEERR